MVGLVRRHSISRMSRASSASRGDRTVTRGQTNAIVLKQSRRSGSALNVGNGLVPVGSTSTSSSVDGAVDDGLSALAFGRQLIGQPVDPPPFGFAGRPRNQAPAVHPHGILPGRREFFTDRRGFPGRQREGTAPETFSGPDDEPDGALGIDFEAGEAAYPGNQRRWVPIGPR